MFGLATAVTMFTDLEIAFPRRPLYLSTRMSLRYPFIYIGCSVAWEYLPIEAKAIGDYLKTGGFAVFENLAPWLEYSPGEASLRQFIRDALGSAARVEIIPNDHPLYHCFFDYSRRPAARLGSENHGRPCNGQAGYVSRRSVGGEPDGRDLLEQGVRNHLSATEKQRPAAENRGEHACLCAPPGGREN